MPVSSMQQKGSNSSPQKHLNTRHTTTVSKLNKLGYKFCLICHIHLTSGQLTTTSSISTTSCGENASTTSRVQKMFSKKEFITSQSMDFCATEINSFFIGKNVLIVMVPILINKDVFEPSNNDLKFTVQNHNYICTNLTEVFLKLCLCLIFFYAILSPF